MQADVYFRNLVAEFEKRKAEEAIRQRDERRPAGGGGLVRIVSEPDEEEEEEGAFFDADESKRSRAGSAKSNITNERYLEKKHDNLGLNINVGVRADSWR